MGGVGRGSTDPEGTVLPVRRAGLAGLARVLRAAVAVGVAVVTTRSVDRDTGALLPRGTGETGLAELNRLLQTRPPQLDRLLVAHRLGSPRAEAYQRPWTCFMNS